MGQGGRKAERARAVPASTAGAGVTLVYVLAKPGGGRGEMAKHGKGTKQPGWGPMARVADSGSRTSAPALPGSALPLARAQSLRSALFLARCPVPGRTTLRMMSHAPGAIAILPGTLRLSAMRPKPEWAYNKQTETTETLSTILSPGKKSEKSHVQVT